VTGKNPYTFFPADPKTLGEAIRDFFEKHELLERVELYQHLARYPCLFPEAAGFSKAVDFKKGTLFLEISDTMFSLEARKMIPRIVHVFQKRGLPVKKVKIRCRLTR